MAITQNSIIPAVAAAEDDYVVENSLKFDGSTSYLSRTFGTPTDNDKWTLSCWIKLSEIPNSSTGANGHYLLAASATDSWTAYGGVYINGSGHPGKLTFFSQDATVSTEASCIIDGVLRDYSAWYHLVVVVNGDNTGGEIEIWINGVNETPSSFTYNGNTQINSASTHYIGRQAPADSGYLGKYLADYHFIDGQAKAATDFGKTDDNGQWVPKAYSGSYGDNGFHLDFADAGATSGSNAGAGKDVSGEGNYFTTDDIGSEDQMGDTPSSGKNYATLNPLDEWAGDGVFAEGNLSFSTTGAFGRGVATIRPSSGKWYGEVYITNHERFSMGVMNETGADSLQGGGTTNSAILNYAGGTYWDTNPTSSHVSALANGNIVSFALDLDNDILWFAVNGTWAQSVSVSAIEAGTTTDSFTDVIGSTVPVTGDHIAMFVESNSTTDDMGCVVNFGQDATFNGNHSGTPVTGGNGEWAYAPPDGFNALCTANLDADDYASVNNAVDAEKAFDVSLWEGTGTTPITITTGMDTGLLWIKDRESGGQEHYLFDSVRGVAKAVYASLSNAEYSEVGELDSLTPTGGGYTISGGGTNSTGDDYVGWSWKAGTTTDDNSSVGNINSGSTGYSQSRNSTAGFSIVQYSSNEYPGNYGSSLYYDKVAHNLGAAPEMIIIKNRDDSQNWAVWHKSLSDDNELALNSDAAPTTNGYFPTSEQAHTDTYFVIGGDSSSGGYEPVNHYDQGTFEANKFIAYLFRSVPGYSHCGHYDGTGSTNFQYTGFRPAMLIVKCLDGTNSWIMFDSSRDTHNLTWKHLFPDVFDAEPTSGTSNSVDFVSNGFVLRTGDSSTNSSSTNYDYVYYAVAENPFKYANAR